MGRQRLVILRSERSSLAVPVREGVVVAVYAVFTRLAGKALGRDDLEAALRCWDSE